MHCITTNVHVQAPINKVLASITTTTGHRGWWWDDCEVGKAAGEEAVYRANGLEVVFRIDRLDDRGIEMTCVRNKNCPEWQGTRLTLHAVEDGSGTYVDLMHDGWHERTPFYDNCVAGWETHLKSLPAYHLTGRGAPFASGKD